MRDPNRLFKIYDIMFNYHKEHPDLRMMQILNNFFRWYEINYNNDGFYLEDDDFLSRFKEWSKKC